MVDPTTEAKELNADARLSDSVVRRSLIITVSDVCTIHIQKETNLDPFYSQSTLTGNVWKCQCKTDRPHNGIEFFNLLRNRERVHPTEPQSAQTHISA